MPTDSNDLGAQRPSAANLKLLSSHPVVCNQARLPTPSIQRAYAEIAEAVTERDAGVSFVAYSRFGKTFAISVLADQLATAFPEVPVLCTNAKEHSTFSEMTFFSELLEGCTRVPTGPGKARDLRNKMVRFLWTLAESRNSDRIVLFVDEAQNWAEPELTALRDVSNDLALFADVVLLVNLFGAPALANTRVTLLQAGRTDLVGRFMVLQYEFQGVTSMADFSATGRCYDDVEISEYPPGSGVSFSEFFMPIAFRDGWRLEQEAALVWDSFQKAARAHGGVKQIGMKWIAVSVRKFLMAQSEWDRAGFHGTYEMWAEAIARSGFIQTLGVTYSSEATLAVPPPGPSDEVVT
ncbi:AAA family ATPase [Massilia sp. BJB1822]|uniref:AAA family ATPase n=1 Tax=Massilia sp. BJB1822 TaxID=2744470 RepID=UPI00159399F2|nr:AAA family ATPase [Massilia sp. BJB1822]NVD97940.1 hypothetical protein [Massilia sp. BJB1822]